MLEEYVAAFYAAFAGLLLINDFQWNFLLVIFIMTDIDMEFRYQILDGICSVLQA